MFFIHSNAPANLDHLKGIIGLTGPCFGLHSTAIDFVPEMFPLMVVRRIGSPPRRPSHVAASLPLNSRYFTQTTRPPTWKDQIRLLRNRDVTVLEGNAMTLIRIRIYGGCVWRRLGLAAKILHR